MKIQGKVTHQALGPGFWGIEGTDGQQWRPAELPKAYQKEGMNVEIDAEELEGQMSVFMWGKAIKINSIKAL